MTMADNQDGDDAQASSDNEGIVYVLTNPAMPGLVKIGKTTQDVNQRLSQLYSTGVPLPFDCEYAVKVDSMTLVEDALHTAFSSSRLNANREFFEVEVDQVRVILDLIKIEDVTSGVDEEVKEGISATDITASNNFKRRRPNLNFGELNIPVGAVLEFVDDSNKTAEVAQTNTTNPRAKTKVTYEGNEYSISGLTTTLLGRQSSHPARHWKYNGRLLRDIYNEVHGV